MATTAPEQAQAPTDPEGVTLAERLDIVTRVARRLFRVPVVLLSLVHQRAPRLFTGQGVPASALGTEVAFDAATLAGAGPLVIPDLLADPRFQEHPWVTGRLQLRFYAGTLLVGPDGAVAGTLAVCDRAPNALAEGDLLLLRELGRLAESELALAALGRSQAELLKQRDQQRSRALVDTRTQLWNRHAMFELLDREFHRAKREQEAVAVILGEIDRFDVVAKQHGAPAGDAVLREVTNRIRGVVRRSDTVSRFGPDEFLVFLGRCDLEAGATLAERMRQRIRKTPIALGGQQHVNVTMTFGVSASEGAVEWTPDTLVRRADEALADAVRGGRDQVAAKRL
ncbi:MAG TPA: sensor domain-containing diguanylate cyclase [Burkholderiales bacterium]|jgi:diguanylate cyclase (GGDEF)-like protein|nr:sensor domain-containing diguanylate cyclase [Burkholderiales bacterium]